MQPALTAPVYKLDFKKTTTMKRILLSISVLALTWIGAQAQITFDKNDLVQKDSTYKKITIDDLSTSQAFNEMDLGESGANGIYDLRTTGNYKYDTSDYRLVNPEQSFLNAHGTATMGTTIESDLITYYSPISFTSADAPAKNETYKYKNVAITDPNAGRLEFYLDVGQSGVNGRYNFRDIASFAQEAADVEILDPASTPWSGDFATANTAKLVEVLTDDNDNVVTETYEFYETKGNDYLRTGVGVKIDQGVLATGTPNGTYVNVNADVKAPHVVRSTNFTPGTRMADSSTWRAEVTQGFTTLKRWNYTKDSMIVNGAGVVYLPKDSFQATRVWKRTMTITVDSITLLGALQPIEYDTLFVQHVEYYAKGFGEPLVRITLDADSVMTGFQYLDVNNSASFTALRSDTTVKIMGFQKKTDNAVSNVGISYIVDFGAVFSGLPSGEYDTLHAPFTGQQLVASSSFADGFTNKDSVTHKISFDRGPFVAEFETAEVQEMEIEGYGTLYLNSDTVEVLRVLIKKTTHETERILFNGMPIGNSSTYSDDTYHMQFWSKLGGIPIAEIEFLEESMTFANRIVFTEVPKKVFISTETVAQENQFSLYPNPTSAQFSVQTSGNQVQQMQVLDLQGRVLLSETINGTSTLDASQWEAGVYLVKMTQPETGAVSTTKLVVE